MNSQVSQPPSSSESLATVPEEGGRTFNLETIVGTLKKWSKTYKEVGKWHSAATGEDWLATDETGVSEKLTDLVRNIKDTRKWCKTYEPGEQSDESQIELGLELQHRLKNIATSAASSAASISLANPALLRDNPSYDTVVLTSHLEVQTGQILAQLTERVGWDKMAGLRAGMHMLEAGRNLTGAEGTSLVNVDKTG